MVASMERFAEALRSRGYAGLVVDAVVFQDETHGSVVPAMLARTLRVLYGRSARYDEMRRNGWPRNRAIVDAVEAHHRQADQIRQAMVEPPAYRALVRGLIPLAIHRPYWEQCFELTDGEERYIEDCAEGVDPAISAAGVEAIMAHPGVHPALTV